MTLRVWLHKGHDGDPGVVAWGLDFLGSVRKALRRLVNHQRVHSKSIARIIGDFRAARAMEDGHVHLG